jgi:hypothetical protein
MADCYALIGETDEALDWLECAISKGWLSYPFLSMHDKILTKLHGHPRFEKLLQEVKSASERLEAL